MNTWYWGLSLITILFIPVIMVVYGSLYSRGLPRKLNSFWGYRTKRTTLNQETWEFAHLNLGKMWLACGATLLPLTLVAMVLQQDGDTNKIASVVLALGIGQVSVLLITFIRIKTILKAAFDEHGNRLSG